MGITANISASQIPSNTKNSLTDFAARIAPSIVYVTRKSLICGIVQTVRKVIIPEIIHNIFISKPTIYPAMSGKTIPMSLGILNIKPELTPTFSLFVLVKWPILYEVKRKWITNPATTADR